MDDMAGDVRGDGVDAVLERAPAVPAEAGGDDAELAARTLAGDASAYGVLVERYQGMLYKLALHALADPDDAADLVQDVYLRAYRGLAAFDPRFKFHTWLYTIAVNALRNQLRQRGLRRWFVPDRRGDADPEREFVDRGPRPDERLFQDEVQRRLLAVLARIPDMYRLPLVLYHFEELGINRIAEALHLPPNTVKTRLKRAREAVLREIERDPAAETFFRDVCRLEEEG